MKPSLALSLAAFAVSSQGLITIPCPPVLGGGFPAPILPSKYNATKKAQSTFRSILKQSIVNGTTEYGPLDNSTTSFSINVFSANDNRSLFDYHYQAPSLNGSLTSGVLNDNTLYRIGSLTKLLTMYTLLIKAGDGLIYDPITKYFPEFAAADAAQNSTFDPINDFAWSKITVGALASHLSGLPRDVNAGDQAAAGQDLSYLGLPPLNASEIPTCSASGDQEICSKKEFLDYILANKPIAKPFHTPQYSNTAFVLLSYVLENITSEKFNITFDSSLLKPLNLSRTYLDLPADASNSIIPINASSSGWDLALGDGSAAGGAYSTAADLSSIGRSILRSQLLDSGMTSRWLKPTTHTASPGLSVGLTWEIMRIEIPISVDSNATRTLDLYTKSGDIGTYSSILVLDPEHEIGFTILAAGSDTFGAWNLVPVLSDLVAATWISAMEEAAREQAELNLVGTYESSDLTTLNSSITFSLLPDRGGLAISSFISNSTDVLQAWLPAFATDPTTQTLSITLYQNSLQSKDEVAFRAAFEALPAPSIGKVFSQDCGQWFRVDGVFYGNVGFDDYVFQVDPVTKQAVSVSPRVLRTTLTRKT